MDIFKSHKFDDVNLTELNDSFRIYSAICSDIIFFLL